MTTAAPTSTAIPATPNTPGPTPTPFASEIGFASGDLQLKGFIWKPEGQGPFPALLWNHGSEKLPGNLADNAAAFVSKGYVFFIPHRRGQGRSPGNYISDQIAAAKTADERSKLLVKLHETEQLQDQLAALTYLKSLNYVDKNRIAVAGCSFGGIQTVLGAEAKGAGYRAAVDFAGGAQSWATSPYLKTRMQTAVLNSAIPIFFIQAENDYDLAPSKELSEVMQKAGKPFKLIFFSPFPAPGADKQEGHEFCVRGVNLWGAEVFAFLSENMN